MTRKPKGYWKNLDNVKRAILAFVAQEGVRGVMPTETELRKAGHGSLVIAIHEHHGGLHDVARRFDLSMTQKSKGYWKDFGNVKREILAFVAERGTPGTMPTATELKRAGRGSLASAISEYHGDFHEVARKLGLSSRYRPKGYWRNFENVRRAVLAFVSKNGNSHAMPAESELRNAGLSSLATAVYQYHGDFHKVARRLNLSTRRKPKNSRHRADSPKAD